MDSRNAEAKLRDRSVLVTGASGFIGSHLVRRLVTAGASVHVLQRSGTRPGRLDAVRSGLTVWEGDVTSFEDCAACVRGAQPQLIIHLAADTSVRRFASWDDVSRSVTVNLTGTLNLLRAAAEFPGAISTFLRAGGLEEYGFAAVPYAEDAREQPSSPYSASQVAGTHYAQMLQRHVPFAIVTLRPALIYGPGQSLDFMIPALIDSCLRGAPFELSAGEHCRELLYIDDAIDAFCIAATTPGLHGEILNIGTGREYGVQYIAGMIARLAGTPGLVRVGAATGRASDLVHLVSDTSRARRALGWQPRVELEEGLARTLGWFRDNRPGKGA